MRPTLRVHSQPLKLCPQHDVALSHLDVQVTSLQRKHSTQQRPLNRGREPSGFCQLHTHKLLPRAACTSSYRLAEPAVKRGRCQVGLCPQEKLLLPTLHSATCTTPLSAFILSTAAARRGCTPLRSL